MYVFNLPELFVFNQVTYSGGQVVSELREIYEKENLLVLTNPLFF